jgi:catechol 2,3-dioxygenase-like lactoylglutathione lyase family enzyme
VKIDSLDHLVLTVHDIPRTVRFYERLGMEHVEFGEDRHALAFGRQRIHLHQAGDELEPSAAAPTPGSGDLCFLTSTPVDRAVTDLLEAGIELVEWPTEKSGAAGALISVYVRDPDGNLVEISNVR